MPFTKLKPVLLSKCCNKQKSDCYDSKDNICSHCLGQANFRKATDKEISIIDSIEYCEWLVNNKI